MKYLLALLLVTTPWISSCSEGPQQPPDYASICLQHLENRHEDLLGSLDHSKAVEQDDQITTVTLTFDGEQVTGSAECDIVTDTGEVVTSREDLSAQR